MRGAARVEVDPRAVAPIAAGALDLHRTHAAKHLNGGFLVTVDAGGDHHPGRPLYRFLGVRLVGVAGAGSSKAAREGADVGTHTRAGEPAEDGHAGFSGSTLGSTEGEARRTAKGGAGASSLPGFLRSFIVVRISADRIFGVASGRIQVERRHVGRGETRAAQSLEGPLRFGLR